MSKNPFSPEDLERIRQTVHAAEGKTSGEIVPYYVARSDDYEESLWRGGLLLGGLALLGLYSFFTYSFYYMPDHWFPFTPAESLLIVLGCTAMGIAAAMWLPPVKRWMAGRALLDHRVASRALQAFVEEEVFETKDRTGILIFLSMFERRVQVLGDKGINARVQQHEWNEIVQLIVDGIKSKRAADGLVAAIQKCGDLLERRDVLRSATDSNELADGLRIGPSE